MSFNIRISYYGKGDWRVEERTTFMEYILKESSEGWRQGYRWNPQWNALIMEPFFAHKFFCQNKLI